MGRSCIDCGGILEPSESSPCLPCEMERAKGREAHGGGARICRDCGCLVARKFDEDSGDALPLEECDYCGSDAIELASVAHRRALKAAAAMEGSD